MAPLPKPPERRSQRGGTAFLDDLLDELFDGP
jgi:hypothetical protein